MLELRYTIAEAIEAGKSPRKQNTPMAVLKGESRLALPKKTKSFIPIRAFDNRSDLVRHFYN